MTSQLQNTSSKYNPYLSVDCVVFGFQVNQLKLLVIEKNSNEGEIKQYKLPGSPLHYGEDIDSAAVNVLHELTGLSNIYLQQFQTYGNPNRISKNEDVEWIKQIYDIDIQRIVSIAYYALINIDDSSTDYKTLNERAIWMDIDICQKLAFDHSEMCEKALETLQLHLKTEPIGFELLPDKFTIRQLQTVYEAILGIELDNRNFRKKVLKAKYLKKLDEYQKGEAYRPALLYMFDKVMYEKYKEDDYGFSF